MVDVGVDAAVRDQPDQVDVPSPLTRPFERLAEGRVLVELAGPNSTGDAHQILVDDPPGADRQVSDLGVAHLAVREPDRLSGRVERRVRIALEEPVEHGRVGEGHGVPRPGRGEAPTVEDDEGYERERAAPWQIAANGSTSREAPPTSAPSTSGWVSSSSALSGLTEPP